LQLAGRYQGVRFVGGRAKRVWTCGCGSQGSLSVEATNSHASNFTLDLTAIRAERRLALTVFRATPLRT
jgi:hypothetical protein